MPPLKVAVLSSLDNAALAALPRLDPSVVEFHVASSLDACRLLRDITALVVIPPFKQDVIDAAWDVAFENVRWVHTFSAGVDFISHLIKKRLLSRTDILFTNGRGAFSR